MAGDQASSEAKTLPALALAVGTLSTVALRRALMGWPTWGQLQRGGAAGQTAPARGCDGKPQPSMAAGTACFPVEMCGRPLRSLTAGLVIHVMYMYS